MFFFFNDTATTEIYTLSLHDALPISPETASGDRKPSSKEQSWEKNTLQPKLEKSLERLPEFTTISGYPIRRLYTDRKSTRLNSSHTVISYAAFCLKKQPFTRSSTSTP